MNAPQQPSALVAADQDQDGQRDRPFLPWRVARTGGAKALVRGSIAAVEEYETQQGLRKRRRRQRDREVFEATIEALVCDLVHRALDDPEAWLSVPFSKRLLGQQGRYGSSVMGEHLPDLVRRLAGLQKPLLELRVGDHFDFDGPRQTTIRAADQLLSGIDALALDYADFARSKAEELIVLKDSREGYFGRNKPIQYEDTETTRRYREEMRLINEWIAGAKIEVDWLRIYDRPDTSDRTLRRIFNNGSFEQGGRLFGGFWQPMLKPDRHMSLRINGERVKTLDFSQMNPRLLYASIGLEPPMRDAYLIEAGADAPRELRSVSLSLQSLDRVKLREAGKRMFSAMTYASRELTRMPEGMRSEIGVKKHVTLREMVEAVRQLHAPVAHLFFRGEGLRLMFKESEVLVAVLLMLRERGIVGLPIHDAVVVPESASEQVREIMSQAFRQHTGQDVEVYEETTG